MKTQHIFEEKQLTLSYIKTSRQNTAKREYKNDIRSLRTNYSQRALEVKTRRIADSVDKTQSYIAEALTLLRQELIVAEYKRESLYLDEVKAIREQLAKDALNLIEQRLSELTIKREGILK